MRFLLVNYEYPPLGGGAATATQAIANNLVALGHAVTVLTARYAGLPALAVENGVTVRRIKSLRQHLDRCSVGEMASFVASALVALPFGERPDATVVFFAIPCGPIGLAAKALLRAPYIVSLRGGDVPGLVPEINRMHRLLRPLRRLVLRHAVAVIANSKGLQDLAEAADPVRVDVIHNGVDTEFFWTAGDAPAPAVHPFRIVFTGRFQAQKNVELLLDQCAALRTESAKRFELHLVGDGPLRDELRQRAEGLGLADITVWHGWTPRDQLRAIYQESHCFVNPSFYEGMPNAVLEAMACAKPIVASDVPGNDAVVQHGTTGLLFALDDPLSLRHALSALMHDPARAAAMGRSGREWAQRDFSWRRVAAAYADFFERPQLTDRMRTPARRASR